MFIFFVGFEYRLGADYGHCFSLQIPACGGAPNNPKSATKVLLFWRKCKSFVILFDFLVVRVRGLGRENGGWIAGAINKERGRMASDENKEEFWCASEVGIECRRNKQRKRRSAQEEQKS